ncbi:hypothetical protein [Halegenticoccus tardaugens]|uniref:hypothetical protein n=1 Tax=Halegenticoccus tardaugens TaxID=2071624 RepID=UPI00100BBE6B|nr:hypothetical protein [Halegenticoccus tardaugens]
MSVARGKKTNQIKVYGDDRDKTMIEAVAAGLDCSEAAAGREAIERLFTELYPDLEWTDVAEGRVSAADLQALAQDEFTVDDLELGNDGDYEPTDRDPARYSTPVTPDQLASPGAKLTWQTLRDAVADPVAGGLWSDELVIHPDRVGARTLRQRHVPASRILAGLARSQAVNGVVRAETLDELVETYAMHLTNRMDDTRGREHIRTEYGRILRTQLWADPRPTSDLYYTSEERYLTALAVVCDEATEVLRETTPAIFDRRVWAEATDTQKSEREWHADVGWVLNAVATARQIVDDVAARTLRQLEITVDEDAKDPCHHFTRLAVSVVKAYRSTVDPVDRQRIEAHHIADKTRTHL